MRREKHACSFIKFLVGSSSLDKAKQAAGWLHGQRDLLPALRTWVQFTGPACCRRTPKSCILTSSLSKRETYLLEHIGVTYVSVGMICKGQCLFFLKEKVAQEMEWGWADDLGFKCKLLCKGHRVSVGASPSELCYLPWIQRQPADQTWWKSSLVLPDSTLPWTELLGACCFLWQPLHNGWSFVTSRWLQVLLGRYPVSKTLRPWPMGIIPWASPSEASTLFHFPYHRHSRTYRHHSQELLLPRDTPVPSISEKTTKVLHTDTLTVKPPVSVETGHTFGSLHIDIYCPLADFWDQDVGRVVSLILGGQVEVLREEDSHHCQTADIFLTL